MGASGTPVLLGFVLLEIGQERDLATQQTGCCQIHKTSVIEQSR
jgi:hypothetical protein